MHTLKGFKTKILSEDSSDIIKTLLENRKVDIAYTWDFFEPKLSLLNDPFLFAGMQKIVDRILQAKETQERVVVFGDYDVDGVSSTALLSKFLASIGVNVSYRLPHRVDDGYGLKSYFIDELAEKDVKLVVTVDCGSRDTEIIEYATDKGIDMIITDHHFTQDPISDKAVAYINPNSPGCKYPFKELSGSGVAFKLVCAIASKLYDKHEYEKIITEYIDFASLGTVADCMPLVGENRIITYFGLQKLRNSSSAGLKHIMDKMQDKEIDGDTIGFRIGPIINAAGRLDTPYKALKFLLAKEDAVEEILSEIDGLNKKRRKITTESVKDALELIDEMESLIFYDTCDIEHGIIGLVSGNICQKHNKPCIVLKDEGDKLVASCRSPEYFNMVEFLECFSEYFVYFGGHAQAAGFTIIKEKYEEFRNLATEKAKEMTQSVDKTKILQIDCPIEISAINITTLDKINKIKPFGLGNPKPLFIIKDFLFSDINLLGADKKHLKFVYNNTSISFVAFNFAEYYEQIKNAHSVHLIGEIDKNTWNGRDYLNFYIRDIIV